MANTRQQRKRIRITARQRNENLRYRSAIRTLFRRLDEQVETGDADRAQSTATKLTSTIDKTAARGTIHKNRAARKKSQVARRLNELQA